MNETTELRPELRALVRDLRAMPGARPEALSRLRARLRQPRRNSQIILSPMRAAALALLLIGATSLIWYSLRATPAPTTPVAVQFVFVHRAAGHVSVVGDFNDWDPKATPLNSSGAGLWSAVVDLPPGPVSYSFVVDGQTWYADPNAAVNTTDFGRPSSVLFVTPTPAAP